MISTLCCVSRVSRSLAPWRWGVAVAVPAETPTCIRSCSPPRIYLISLPPQRTAFSDESLSVWPNAYVLLDNTPPPSPDTYTHYTSHAHPRTPPFFFFEFGSNGKTRRKQASLRALDGGTFPPIPPSLLALKCALSLALSRAVSCGRQDGALRVSDGPDRDQGIRGQCLISRGHDANM